MPHTGSMTSASVAVSGGVEVVDIEVSGPAGAGPTRDPTLLHVLLRVGVELRLAALRAEVVGRALVFAGAGGLGRVHLHAAHGVLHRCLLSLRRTSRPAFTGRPSAPPPSLSISIGSGEKRPAYTRIVPAWTTRIAALVAVLALARAPGGRAGCAAGCATAARPASAPPDGAA